jgi:hypothetical protein
LVVVSWRDARGGAHGTRPFAVFAGLAVAELGFYVFIYSTVEVQERYLTTVLPIFAVLAGAGLATGYRRFVAPGPRSRSFIAIGILAVWLVAQIAIADAYQNARSYYANEFGVTAATMRELTDDLPCTGVSRLGAPQLHLGSGCAVSRATDPELAASGAEEAARAGDAVFIVWPGTVSEPLDLGPSWMVIDRSTEWVKSVLYFRPAGAAG